MTTNKQIGRADEVNIIGQAIPGTSDILLGVCVEKKYWMVKTHAGIQRLTKAEVESIYNLDLDKSDLERLGWTA